jgi:hypothetical protein
MELQLVATVNGVQIYRLPFGGASVKVAGRLIEAFYTIEDAFRWAANLPTEDTPASN